MSTLYKLFRTYTFHVFAQCFNTLLVLLTCGVDLIRLYAMVENKMSLGGEWNLKMN